MDWDYISRKVTNLRHDKKNQYNTQHYIIYSYTNKTKGKEKTEIEYILSHHLLIFSIIKKSCTFVLYDSYNI